MNPYELAKRTHKSINYYKSQKGLLILGNGFDMNLHRKITYLEFYKSEFWPKEDTKSPLGDFLDHRLERDYWYNLEAALSDYVDVNNADVIRDSEKDMLFYRALERGMIEYASRKNIELIDSIKRAKGKQVEQVPLAYHIFEIVLLNPCYTICSFNFTELESLVDLVRENNAHDKKCNPVLNGRLEYIHGSIATKDLIIGAKNCDTYQGLELIRKTNRLKNTKIVAKLREVDQVIFFGHSLSEVDRCYFDDFFKTIKDGSCKCRSVLIFTADEKSKLDIKNNLYNFYGIDWECPKVEYYTDEDYRKQISDGKHNGKRLNIFEKIDNLSLGV